MMTLDTTKEGRLRFSTFSCGEWKRFNFQNTQELDTFLLETYGETWDGSKSIPSSQ